jgi:hypothetical protein
MKQFSKINNKLNKEDFIYSEITALCFMNPTFFDFLNDERWKYLTQDSVFNNSLHYELKKWNIELLDKEEICVCIEEHWDFLKASYKIALELKSRFSEIDKILVAPKVLNFKKGDETIIFRDKIQVDMITQLDLENVLDCKISTLYTKNVDSLVNLYIEHLKSYLKPSYLEGLLYFLDIFYEKSMDINYYNYKNYKIDGLGYRNEFMPKLYYNNLSEYCKDLLFIKDAFRDYNLMFDSWKNIKNNTLNKEYLLPIFKNKIKEDSFLFLIEKYYSLANKDYYKADKNDSLIHLPSKEDFRNSFNGDFLVSYKTNDDKDLIICVVWGNIELRIKIGFGISLYEFYYAVDVVENNGFKKLD